MTRIFGALFLFLVIVCGAAAATIATFDIDAHRERILQKLTEETGRTVHLNGPIRLDVSLDGILLRLEDGSISNPPWASRPDMAGVGHFELKIAPLPLLEHRLVITALSVVNADIQLESREDQRPNWDLSSALHKSSDPSAASTKALGRASDVAVAIDQLSIKDSQLAFRAENGGITIFKTKSLTLARSLNATRLKFSGVFNDQSLALNAVSNADDITSRSIRPLTLDVAFGNIIFTADGEINFGQSMIDLSHAALSFGKTNVTGALQISWKNVTPLLSGTLAIDQLSLADIHTAPASAQDVVPSLDNGLLLSDKIFNLSALSDLNANVKMAIGTIPLGLTSLNKIEATVSLLNGNLFISPLSAELGSSSIAGQLHINTKVEPPTIGLSINAPGINLSDIFVAGGVEALLSGKVDIDANLITSGSSPHELASHLSGSFNLIGAGGNVINRASNKIIGGLAAMFLSGSDDGNDALNCLVARFTASNGVILDNGILLDTSEATVSGKGGFDLRDEAIDLLLRGKPKSIVSADLLPPFHMGGTFSHPSYSVDAGAIFQNVANLITGYDLADAVPTITAVQGQNACAAALAHGTGETTLTPTTGVVQQFSGKAGALLKGFIGQ